MDEFEVRDQRQRLYYWIEIALLEHYGSKLGPYGIAVYNALCKFADFRYHNCWPSFQTISSLIGCTRRQVITEIKKLEELGLIHVERRNKQSNLYTLLTVSPGSEYSSPGSEYSSPGSEYNSPELYPIPIPTNKATKTNFSNPIWNQALCALKDVVPPTTFVDYLAKCKVLDFSDSTLRLMVPDVHTQKWIRHRLCSTIEKALIGVTGKKITIEVIVDEESNI